MPLLSILNLNTVNFESKNWYFDNYYILQIILFFDLGHSLVTPSCMIQWSMLNNLPQRSVIHSSIIQHVFCSTEVKKHPPKCILLLG